MAYKKTNWVDDETPLSAENLNKMEEGIVEASQTGGILTVTIVEYDGETVPEGYEQIEDEADGILTGTVVGFNGDTIPEGYKEVPNPNVYSTEEKVIGEWIDGKPLYRKVIELASELTIDANSWASGVYAVSNIKLIVNALGLKIGDATSQIRATPSGDIMNPSSAFSISIKFITLEYTKTTD